MKKLLTICLLMATVFTINAQDGKPTKEETVQFIKEYYQNNILSTGVSGYTDKNNKEIFYNKSVENIDVQFDKKLNIFSFYLETIYYINISTVAGPWKTTKYSKDKYIIDLSKIELINQTNFKMRKEDNMYEIKINFKATQGYKIEHFYISNNESLESLVLPSAPAMKNTIDIPVNFYAADNGFEHSTHNKKNLQAFNHLRKLCGAPEPISFD